MSVRLIRRTGPEREVSLGARCDWLFEERDFWAEESTPILVTGGTGEDRSRFLAKDLTGCVPAGNVVMVLFSPESPGGILEALTEALRALFPELDLGIPSATGLMEWGLAVDRATKRCRVDLKRRLLMVDGLEEVWKAPAEPRARFVDTLRCLARQRSVAVVAAVAEERLPDCAKLPGFGHAFRERELVPIVCRSSGSVRKRPGSGVSPE